MYIGKLRKAGVVVVSSNCFQRCIVERLKIRIVNNDTRGNNFILWLGLNSQVVSGLSDSVRNENSARWCN